MESIVAWVRRQLSNPEIVLLGGILVAGLLVVVLLGQVLAGAIAALVIAYILDSPVRALDRRGVPHLASVTIMFLTFLGVIFVMAVTILPVVSQQLAQLVSLLPSMLGQVQDLLVSVPERYPRLLNAAQMEEIIGSLRGEMVALGQNVLRFSLGSIGNALTIVTYSFLVPFLVFFMLKDRDRLLGWISGWLPEERHLVHRVWKDVDRQIGAYMRGKVYEIGILAAASWLAFTVLGVDLALLLAVLTGLSVLIPYVGVAVVTVPVALVAFFQFGASGSMLAVVATYGVIQVIDGNILAPLVISDAVDLHPVAVILAVLGFGGIWGFWGVFFAIPLATVVVAVLNAWQGVPLPHEAAESPAPPAV